MKQRLFIVMLLGVLVASTAMLGPAHAGKEKKKLNGQDLYKANCKVCHGKNAEHGEYTPMSLIMDQWDRFFEKKYASTHEELKHPEAEGKTLKEVLTPEQLKAIQKFCVDHAADSENPMTCG